MTISQILAAAASREGLEVRLFEGTGITQRGGGVYAFVRFGEAREYR
jgi:Pyruvate/2-oxoacid:ferredoxin oxidoreductase gamma subunit